MDWTVGGSVRSQKLEREVDGISETAGNIVRQRKANGQRTHRQKELHRLLPPLLESLVEEADLHTGIKALWIWAVAKASSGPENWECFVTRNESREQFARRCNATPVPATHFSLTCSAASVSSSPCPFAPTPLYKELGENGRAGEDWGFRVKETRAIQPKKLSQLSSSAHSFSFILE